jgi:hypothetical protein
MMKPLDVFLSVGQSEAGGGSHEPNLAPVPPAGTVFVMDWVTNTIVPAQEPIRSPVPLTGPGNWSGGMYCAFGTRWNQLAGRKVLIVQCAFVGALVPKAADPGTAYWGVGGALTPNSCDVLDSVLTVARNTGFEPRFCGPIWYQGQYDGSKLVTQSPLLFSSADYYSETLRLAAYYRNRYGKKLPFWRIRIGTASGPASNLEPGYAKIRLEQDMCAVTDPLSPIIYDGAVSFAARGLVQADGIHCKQLAHNECGTASAEFIFNSGFAAVA